MATAEQIQVANKTSRNSPAVGAKALTPKTARQYMDNNLDKDTAWVLDFGAGKHAMHAQELVADGWKCLAHEFGDNIDPKLHCELAMLNEYDVVYASNVLNVQSDEAMLHETLEDIKRVLKDDGVFFANYPLSPRKAGLSMTAMRDILQEHFEFVMHVNGKKGAPVWFIKKYLD